MEELIHLVAQHGVALVFANVLLQQLGLPIPAVPTLIVAGALAAEGKLSAAAVFAVAVLACMIGDGAWYAAGRAFGRPVLNLLCRVSLSPDSCVRQSEYHFERWGAAALVLSKFIPGLSTIAPPLAGALRLGWLAFALLDGVGVALWAGAPILGGMLFYAELNRVGLALEGLGTAAIGLVVAIVAAYIAFKWWERKRFYRTLRLARISVEELRSLMDRGPQPVVVDVRSEVARKSDGRFIPGALVIDADEVDERLSKLPSDREIIFYCTCPNEASAAQVAKRLIDLGYKRVRPLHGGLDAWLAAGHEVELRQGA